MTDTNPSTNIADDDTIRAGLELARIGLWTFDPAAGLARLSPRAAELYGASNAPALDVERWRAALDIADRDRASAILDNAGRTLPESVIDLALTGGGGVQRHLRESWRVTRWSGTRPAMIVGVVSDVSEELRGDARRRELIHELQHRMKGVLSLVRSLARRTAAHSRSIDDFVAHFDGRLAALGHVETTLSRTHDGRADLEDIVRQELVHSLGSDEGVVVQGPAVALRGKIAELVALALHELSANAVKFGALSGGGAVSITWTLSDDTPQQLSLVWAETWAPTSPVMEHRGFGLSLIEQGLPYELGAEVETRFEQDGLVCAISLPLRPRGSG